MSNKRFWTGHPASTTPPPPDQQWKRRKLDSYRETSLIESDEEEECSDIGTCSIEEQCATPQTSNLPPTKIATASRSTRQVSKKTLEESSSSPASKRRLPQRTPSGQLRWILRKQSTLPLNDQVKEVSELDVAACVLEEQDEEDLTNTLESWSLTHVRARRRNNLYADNETDRRKAVLSARRDIMRSFRRTEADI